MYLRMKKIIISSTLALLVCVSVVTAQEYTFSQDLSVGATGAEVVALQKWLISNGYDIQALSSGAAGYGYFGTQTREAVRRFQEHEGLPNTGYFGRLSRGRVHGKKLPPVDSRAPVISGVDAPTVLNVGETGTWTIRATDPQNGTLQYSVDWGDVLTSISIDCIPGYICEPNPGAKIAEVQQGSTFTHSYSSAKTYTVRFVVRNSVGLTARSSATVKVVDANVSPLNIISPNGGEVWQKGSTQAVTWNAPAYFRATYADITLVPYMAPCNTSAPCPMYKVMTYPIAKGISINQNSFTWKVGDYIPEVMTMIYPPVYPTVPDGQYTVQICEVGGGNCDTSNRPFTISSSTSESPKVSSPNGGETWVAHSAQYLRWTMPTTLNTNTRLDLYLDQKIECNVSIPAGAMTQCPPINTYVLDKNIPITMAYNWLVATDVNNVKIPDGSYRFRVCIAGSTTNCDSSDQSFKIVSNVAVPDVNIVSPNGGQTYRIGSQVPISWKLDGTMRPEYAVWLTLGTGTGGGGYILTRKATDATTYTWTVPDTIISGDVGMSLVPGTYKVHIGLYDGPVCTGFCAPGNYGKLIAYDDSDTYITITR